MTTECTCWHIVDRNEGRTGTIRKMPREDCPKCGGTGEAQPDYALKLAFAKTPDGSYLLPDSVRVKCLAWTTPLRYLELSTEISDEAEVEHQRQFHLERCSCREGFTVLDPATGSDTWARELWPLLRAVEARATAWVNVYVTKRAEGDTPAALAAAWQALVTAGVVKETPWPLQ